MDCVVYPDLKRNFEIQIGLVGSKDFLAPKIAAPINLRRKPEKRITLDDDKNFLLTSRT